MLLAGLARLLPKKNFQVAHKAKGREVRSPTCEVLGSFAKNLRAQSILLDAPGYRASFRQQLCPDLRENRARRTSDGSSSKERQVSYLRNKLV